MIRPLFRGVFSVAVLCAVLIGTMAAPAAADPATGTQTASCAADTFHADLDLDWGGCSLAVLDGDSTPPRSDTSLLLDDYHEVRQDPNYLLVQSVFLVVIGVLVAIVARPLADLRNWSDITTIPIQEAEPAWWKVLLIRIGGLALSLLGVALLSVAVPGV